MPEARVRRGGTRPVPGGAHRRPLGLRGTALVPSAPLPTSGAALVPRRGGTQPLARPFPACSSASRSPWEPRSPRRFWTRAGAQAATAARLGRGGGGALAVGTGLRAVAADLHRAPLARPVAGGVVERPSTVIGRTDLDPVEPTLDG